VAVFEFKETSRALVPIHADTLAEAKAKADEIHAEDIEDWDFLYEDAQMLDVRPAEEAAGEGVDNV
jgi:hypothetical protein